MFDVGKSGRTTGIIANIATFHVRNAGIIYTYIYIDRERVSEREVYMGCMCVYIYIYICIFCKCI